DRRLPLPKGEGRGEGEQDVRIVQRAEATEPLFGFAFVMGRGNQALNRPGRWCSQDPPRVAENRNVTTLTAASKRITPRHTPGADSKGRRPKPPARAPQIAPRVLLA